MSGSVAADRRGVVLAIVVALVGGLLATATLVVPAAAWAQGVDEPLPGLSIRLVDPPIDENDPRTAYYVIGHFEPGSTFERVVEVGNGDQRRVGVTMLVADGQVDDGFHVADGAGQGEIATWTTFEPDRFVLGPGERLRVTVRVAIPQDVDGGERQAAFMAQPDPRESGGQVVVARVGVRAYVSVGGDAAPLSDFRIDALQPLRSSDGVPSVRIAVTNIGGRTLDVVGTLRLSDGPGSLSAGPFPVSVAQTLGPGASGEVVVALDPALPAGPWRAIVDLTGGPVHRSAEAIITFPDVGDPGAVLDQDGTIVGEAVPARPIDRARLLPINLVLLILAIGLLAFFWAKDRRDGEDPSEQPEDAPNAADAVSQ